MGKRPICVGAVGRPHPQVGHLSTPRACALGGEGGAGTLEGEAGTLAQRRSMRPAARLISRLTSSARQPPTRPSDGLEVGSVLMSPQLAAGGRSITKQGNSPPRSRPAPCMVCPSQEASCFCPSGRAFIGMHSPNDPVVASSICGRGLRPDGPCLELSATGNPFPGIPTEISPL